MAIYDAEGNPVGALPRARMRAEGRWHAAASVLLRSGDGRRVYVHRRTEDKDVYPGMHDCWAGGVLLAGEEPAACARRELAEELGVRDVPLTPLFRLPFVDGTIRYHAFTYEARWDGPVIHQPEEVAEGGWMSLDDLRTRLADPTWPFTPDGRALFHAWDRRQTGHGQ
ncbi:Isopentenyldiphosphate isomerase [Streptoalloteichus tenebrarius]|uniref:Isopentenyldiphosphate isomerase n=1 Tax=Streptoalloteichus tenebrarius (strain ATCC 17920 / DSM 40477 / JCM 4838 / CBS 697.72 / NBRC 16177 / NCIMB 11028 / NRRL B-12390 / A12253. 1 / ISP 5477) TaxID=1933 RepID=A0ABT1HP76_STRSD|nr:Isopentenyldiphosphate isomerase [Streptoalloteichus tenebrarius]